MKTVCVVLTFLLLGGCAYPRLSFHRIRERAKTVSAADGISREEAVLLAQDHIVRTGLDDRLYSLEPFKIEPEYVWRKENGEEIEFVTPPPETFQPEVEETWRVFFRDREGSLFWGRYAVIPFYVNIDRKTGEVKDWGLDKENR